MRQPHQPLPKQSSTPSDSCSINLTARDAVKLWFSDNELIKMLKYYRNHVFNLMFFKVLNFDNNKIYDFDNCEQLSNTEMKIGTAKKLNDSRAPATVTQLFR